ncbi:MAG: hypothetical protein U0166_14140 [Acidobacteriota bacterium]
MPDASSLLNEGVALLRRGNAVKARTCFERLNKAEPSNPLGLSYLGVSLALTDRNFSDGEDFCFRAVLKGMGNAQLHANLAWVYYLAGKRKSALTELEEAKSRDPGNPDALRIERMFGKRQSPPISVLPRNHPLNKGLGKILYKLKGK